MCGICGLFYYNDNKKIAEEIIIRKMTETLFHRGPDDEGFFFKENFGMGVRRLSIIDIHGGHQPIHNEDKSIWVICNGEIYDFIELRKYLLNKGHKFYTKTDTEVLVHLYEEFGESCVDKLNGMFAFAIFDTKDKKLFIARDRIGIKPLYYYDKNGLFVFGSEIKAILQHPKVKKALDINSLNIFLSLNYITAPHTIFTDIKQLPPSYILIVSKNRAELKQYWDVMYKEDIRDTEDIIAQDLQEMLNNTIKKHLISDVPVGAFLSGGLDSSSIVAIITKVLKRPLKTFSVGFEEKSFDESKKAKKLSDYFKTEHYEVFCRPTDLIDHLPKMVWQADNLLADPAMLPLYLVCQLAKFHVGVALSGDGGDEIFAGYPTYLANSYRNYYRRLSSFVRKKIIAKIANFIPASTRKLGFDYKIKKFIEGAEFLPEKSHYWWRTIFSDEEKKCLFSKEAASFIEDLDSFDVYKIHFDKNRYSSFSSGCLYSDLKVWLPDNNLIRVDAISMAHSLEIRVPFLDYEIVEFMARVPFNMKLRRRQPKYILRQALRKLLPKDTLNYKKSPWHVPLATWFKTDLYDYIRQSLLDSEITERFFNRDYVKMIIKNHKDGKENNSFKIWGLLVFANWYNVFKPTDIS